MDCNHIFLVCLFVCFCCCCCCLHRLMRQFTIQIIYTLSDLGELSNLIGSLSRTIQQCSPPSEWVMCELCLFPIFLENDLLKVYKILGFLSVTVSEFCGRWIVYNQQKIVNHTLLGRGVYSEFFPRKAGLSMHFTDSKSECPGYPPTGGEATSSPGRYSLALEEPGKRALGTRLVSGGRHSPSTKTLWKTPENIS